MKGFARWLGRTFWASLLAFVAVIAVQIYQAHAAPSPATETAEMTATDAAPRTDGAKTDGAKTATTAETDGAPAPTRGLQSLRDRRTPTPIGERLLSVFGIFVLMGLAWLLSTNRRAIRWRPVFWGIGLQILFGLIVLSPTVGDFFFTVVNQSVSQLLHFAEAGADFLFQTVQPHEVTTVDLATGAKETSVYIGHISPPLKTFAFWILPTIIFFSALMNILYHLGVMQFLVRIMAAIMRRTMGTSGSESLSAAANIFVGQTEAPLVVKPFIDKMTRSELNAVMIGGFATVAGGVLAAYVGMLHTAIPDIAGHLVVASIMSAPAALAIAKIILPETEVSETAAGAELNVERPDKNLIEALARGSTDGLNLAVNVAAMLVAFVAMVALVNFVFGAIGGLFGLDISLESVLGQLFAPIAWSMGVPWEEAATVGRLFGEKMVLTELIAYSHLAEIMKDPTALSYRSAVIASYALCGFANFASVGIQIGGIGGIAPERRTDLAVLGVRAMFGGTIAALMTATIAGIIL